MDWTEGQINCAQSLHKLSSSNCHTKAQNYDFTEIVVTILIRFV